MRQIRIKLEHAYKHLENGESERKKAYLNGKMQSIVAYLRLSASGGPSAYLEMDLGSGNGRKAGVKIIA